MKAVSFGGAHLLTKFYHLSTKSCHCSTTAMKHCDQSKLGKKGLTWLTLPCYSPLLKEVRTVTQTGQELRCRSWCRNHGEVLLTGLLIMACSACFLIESNATMPRMAAPTILDVPHYWMGPMDHLPHICCKFVKFAIVLVLCTST